LKKKEHVIKKVIKSSDGLKEGRKNYLKKHKSLNHKTTFWECLLTTYCYPKLSHKN